MKRNELLTDETSFVDTEGAQLDIDISQEQTMERSKIPYSQIGSGKYRKLFIDMTTYSPGKKNYLQ